ncbi:OsmC family protein [Robiginitalea aurantiaca]|uniref:OsmC family protein n=1 Tax=Robiginitalea aurantiaca TaxID=3056915 RepID=A0ABT7WI89_9FLAO|nr:OsmC family protein [Robiginitalea aurantiaca]MDM9632620.1 OsmC family protein [Robiginitalea aurantiaca]
MTSKVEYKGNLRTTCTHLKSGDQFNTDAPVDNHGLGEAFSPTDTVATGLASCMLTMMGIRYGDMQPPLDGAYGEVTKHMAADPRRISRIDVNLYLPAGVSEKNQKLLEKTARTCPVWFSLHEAIQKEIRFFWTL